MRKLYLPIGMIGSGKSTWARQRVTENSDIVIVGGDAIRTMLHGGKYFYHSRLEPAIRDTLLASAKTMLEWGFDVILDECYCGLSREQRRETVAGFHGMEVECVAVVFPERDMKDRIEDKVVKGLRGKTVAYWKRVFREMAEMYEPVCPEKEPFFNVVLNVE